MPSLVAISGETGEESFLSVKTGAESFPIASLQHGKSPDGGWPVIAAGEKAFGVPSGCIAFYDLCSASGKEETMRLKGHFDTITGLEYVSESLLASCSYDQAVVIWDVEEQRQVSCFQGHQNYIRAISHIPSRDLLASSSDDATVRVWDIDRECEAHRFEVRCPANVTCWHAGADLLAVAGSGVVYERFNRVQRGVLLLSLDNEDENPVGVIKMSERVTAMCIVPENHHIVLGTGDGCVLVYDDRRLRGSLMRRKMHGSRYPSSRGRPTVTDVCWYADSRYATASADHSAAIWDSGGSERKTTMRAQLDDAGTSITRVTAIGGSNAVKKVGSSMAASGISEQQLQERVGVIVDNECCSLVLKGRNGGGLRTSLSLLFPGGEVPASLSARMIVDESAADDDSEDEEEEGENGESKSRITTTFELFVDCDLMSVDEHVLLGLLLGDEPKFGDGGIGDLLSYFRLFHSLRRHQLMHATLCSVERIFKCSQIASICLHSMGELQDAEDDPFRGLSPFEFVALRHYRRRALLSLDDDSDVDESHTLVVGRLQELPPGDEPFWQMDLRTHKAFIECAVALPKCFFDVASATLVELSRTRYGSNVMLVTDDGGKEAAPLEVLLARSELFARMFSYSGSEVANFQATGELPVEHYTSSALEALLRWIFVRRLPEIGVDDDLQDQIGVLLRLFVTGCIFHEKKMCGAVRRALRLLLLPMYRSDRRSALDLEEDTLQNLPDDDRRWVRHLVHEPGPIQPRS